MATLHAVSRHLPLTYFIDKPDGHGIDKGIETSTKTESKKKKNAAQTRHQSAPRKYKINKLTRCRKPFPPQFQNGRIKYRLSFVISERCRGTEMYPVS